MQKAKRNGVEIHTRSAFLQGLFFKKIDKISSKLNPLKRYLEKIQQLSNLYNLDVGSLALNYVCENKVIDNVLIGVDSVQQLEQNLLSLKKPYL